MNNLLSTLVEQAQLEFYYWLKMFSVPILKNVTSIIFPVSKYFCLIFEDQSNLTNISQSPLDFYVSMTTQHSCVCLGDERSLCAHVVTNRPNDTENLQYFGFLYYVQEYYFIWTNNRYSYSLPKKCRCLCSMKSS